MIAKRLVGVVVLLIVAGAIAACGVNVIASSDGDAAVPGGDSSSVAEDADAAANDVSDDGGGGLLVDSGVEGDGAMADASDASDASDGSIPFSCPDASTTFTGGTLKVPKAALPVTLDGDLSEWKCARFFTYDAGTAAKVDAVVPAANVYSFAVAWDPAYVYVAAHVLDATLPRGAIADTQNYKNDSIEVYLGGDTTFVINYTSKDHQYVVDWANRAYVYNNNNPNGPPSAGFASNAKSTNAGFDIELRIPASDVGRASFTSPSSLGFAFAANENNGTNQHGWALWYRPTGIVCSGCCDVWCNAVYFGDLVLQ